MLAIDDAHFLQWSFKNPLSVLSFMVVIIPRGAGSRSTGAGTGTGTGTCIWCRCRFGTGTSGYGRYIKTTVAIKRPQCGRYIKTTVVV